MNSEERRAAIEEYGRGYHLLFAALADVPREAWDFKPAPGEWNIHQILDHMTDTEIMAVVRIYRIIAEPGSTLMAYDTDQWNVLLRYQNQHQEDALELFRIIRRRTYQLLLSLPEQIFNQSVVHPEQDEPYTFDQWVVKYTSHVDEHVEQIEKNHKAWKEQNPY